MDPPVDVRGLPRLFGPTALGIALIEAPRVLRWANEAFLRTMGLPTDAIGKDLGMEPTFVDGPLSAALGRALQGHGSTTLRNLRLPARTSGPGTPPTDAWVWATAARGEERGPVMVVVSSSEERAQEHERSLMFYQSFLTSTNPMEVTDTRGILVDVNPAFERTYGYSRAECVGKRPNLVRSRVTPVAVYESMWKELLDPKIGHWSGELMNRDRRGQERPVFLTITAIRDEVGTVTHYLGVAVDLSVQKQWEKGAARADRLASVGQLAAGVAHEINTPLANISLISESLKRKSQDPWLTGRANALLQQVEVAAKIVRGLLDFSRRTEPQMVDLDLVQVARDTVEFLRGKQSALVELEEHFPSQPLPISGDRGQLMQVLTNVLNNAYDAIEGAGRVVLRLRRDGETAEVEIADSGPGILPEVLPHIFEPFFTTKEEGRGTGLGLAICQGIMAAHRGGISAHNLVGGGASFLVRLPLRDERERMGTPTVLPDPPSGENDSIHPTPSGPGHGAQRRGRS